MRTLLTPYSLVILLATFAALSYPSCEPAGPITEELPQTATEYAWTQWNCASGPNFFAAWDNRDSNVWREYSLNCVSPSRA